MNLGSLLCNMETRVEGFILEKLILTFYLVLFHEVSSSYLAYVLFCCLLTSWGYGLCLYFLQF